MMGFSASERKAAFALAAVFASRMLGLFMIMPVFALYGPELEGFSPIWMGLAIGVYGLTQACLQIPMGAWSDRIGRKPVIYLGLLLFVLGSILAACSSHIYGVIAGRALQGAGAISSAVMALAADLSREHQRPKVMAVIGIFIGLSFTIALVVGPLVAHPFGLAGLFWLTAALALVSLALVKFVVPDAKHQAPSGDTLARWSVVRQLMKNAPLWRLSLAILALHFCMTGLFTVLPTQLMADTQLGALWYLLLPVLLTSFLLLAPLMRRYQGDKVKSGVMLCGTLLLFSVLLMSESHAVWAYAIALLLYFTGFNYLEASLPALVAQVAPAGQKGSAMGLFASCQFGGAFLGGIGAGLVVTWFGDAWVWWMMALVLVAWLLLARSLQVETQSKGVCLTGEASAQQLEQLCQLPGVIEARYVAAEAVTYLKVERERFELADAEAILVEK